MFLKACSNMVVISKRPRCGLLLSPSLGTNAVLAPGGDHRTRIVLIALVWLCGGVLRTFCMDQRHRPGELYAHSSALLQQVKLRASGRQFDGENPEPV